MHSHAENSTRADLKSAGLSLQAGSLVGPGTEEASEGKEVLCLKVYGKQCDMIA